MITVTRFTAAWCGPCRMVTPIMEELKEEFPQVEFITVNTDENPTEAKVFNVQSIPCVVITKDGTEVFRIIGANPKEHYRGIIQRELQETVNGNVSLL